MKKDLGAKPLLFPTPVLVVGTYNLEGRSNAMTAAWGGVCCSSPPCVAISLRKATYSYNNLMEAQAFTINIPGKAYAQEADYLGMASGRNGDKLARCGLTPVKSDFVNAPYIAEFPVNLECKIVNVTELGLHTQFVGEILNIKMDETLLGPGKPPAIEQILPLIFDPDGGNYYTLGANAGKAFAIGRELMSKD